MGKDRKHGNAGTYWEADEHGNVDDHKVSVARNYKDTVFRMLYRDKRELLALYNAENGSDYENPDDLEVYTLESAVYMGMKNDVSFIVDTRLVLYEHQSTINENMPLRDLFYVARQYEQLMAGRDLYGKAKIKLPAPRFIVFYNGKTKQPEKKEIKLSEAYFAREETPSLELKVVQLNINPGYNEELKRKCPTLHQYMQYVEKVRAYERNMPIRKAVEQAVDECIREGILKDFFMHEKAQVVSMSIFEFDQELHDKTLFEEGREEGRAEGREAGREEGATLEREKEIRRMVSKICRKLRKKKTPEQIAEELEEDDIEKICRICEILAPCAPDYEEKEALDKMAGFLDWQTL